MSQAVVVEGSLKLDASQYPEISEAPRLVTMILKKAANFVLSENPEKGVSSPGHFAKVLAASQLVEMVEVDEVFQAKVFLKYPQLEIRRSFQVLPDMLGLKILLNEKATTV